MKASSRGWGGAGRRLPARRFWVPAFAVLLGAAAIVRARYGVDFSDSSHAVALAMRMARGDVPFRDEMNLQVLGSWPAVPFVWAWLHLVGLDGIVWAARIWFVLFSGLCGYVCWRAVSPVFGRGTTAAALAVALIPAAYNQQVVSYNTTPALMYLVGTCAGMAAITRRSLPWGVVSGATVVLGAVSHPVTTPAAVALLLVVVVLARGRGLVGLLAGAVGLAVVVGALAVLVWGVPAISDTLRFTADYQSTRPAQLLRTGRWLSYLRDGLAAPTMLVALALAVLAAVPPLRRIRSWLLVAAVLLTGIHALHQASSGATFSVLSWFSGVLGTVLLVVLLPVTVVCAVRRRAPLLRMVAIGLAPTLVGLPFVAGYTSSSPLWGATTATLAPGLFAAVLASLVWLQRDGWVGKAALTAALVGSLAAVHGLNSFRDGPPNALVATMPDGAYAGLATTPEQRDLVEQDQRALSLCGKPGDGALDYLFPAGFLMGDVRFDTPIIWLDFFGRTSDRVLQWIDRTGRVPTCVIAARNFWPGFGRHHYLRLPDPLREWVVAHYRVVSQTPHVVVLQRRT